MANALFAVAKTLQKLQNFKTHEDHYNVHQILLAPSDADYLDQLITTINDASLKGDEDQLIDELSRFSDEREAEIERMCNSNHQDFVQSVNQLLVVRRGTYDLTSEILRLNQTIQASTEKLVEQKKALVDSRDVRQNIDEATQSLNLCLEVLQLANRVRDLIQNKSHYAALRTLDELQSVHLKEVLQFNLASLIQNSVPAMQRMIKDAVMSDLNSWLYRVRETSQLLGQVAFDQTELRRRRQRERCEKAPYLRNFKLNSAIELVLDEREEFDVLDNEDVNVDFTPLFECIHIYNAMGEKDEFKMIYSDTRKQQKELLLSTKLEIKDDDIGPLAALLEQVTGFAILEKATMKKTMSFRSPVEVDELWDSMCKKAISIISPAVVNGVNNAETLLKIKNILALFIQTMDSWEYNAETLDEFLLVLFNKYSDLLKSQFCNDFKDIVQKDDYMPMPISNLEEYENVVNLSWYKPDRDKSQIQFPCILPFSQMYPLCCIDIRNFLNKYYFFSDDYFQHQSIIDDTLKDSLDELLVNQVCKSLVERLNSKYLGQIVQILINLEQFEYACQELEILLVEARSTSVTLPSSSFSSPPPPSAHSLTLKATNEFRISKKAAEKRIFELVNSKIDDLVETADYSWNTTTPQREPSAYLQEMTRYLSNIMNSTLLGLPKDIKGLIYFDALSHLASSVLSLPLSSAVKAISPVAVQDLDLDVKYLMDFVNTLTDDSPMLPTIFEELRQTIELLKSDNSDEFYNIETRMRRYASVDPINGPILLEKVLAGSKIKVGRR